MAFGVDYISISVLASKTFTSYEMMVLEFNLLNQILIVHFYGKPSNTDKTQLPKNLPLLFDNWAYQYLAYISFRIYAIGI